MSLRLDFPSSPQISMAISQSLKETDVGGLKIKTLPKVAREDLTGIFAAQYTVSAHAV